MTEVFVIGVFVIGKSGFRTATSTTEFVKAGVGGNSVRPGRERCATIEAIECRDNCNQRLLGGIESIGVVSCESPTDRVNPSLMLLQKGVKGAAIVAPSSCD